MLIILIPFTIIITVLHLTLHGQFPGCMTQCLRVVQGEQFVEHLDSQHTHPKGYSGNNYP